jgi:hypothetical protein
MNFIDIDTVYKVRKFVAINCKTSALCDSLILQHSSGSSQTMNIKYGNERKHRIEKIRKKLILMSEQVS